MTNFQKRILRAIHDIPKTSASGAVSARTIRDTCFPERSHETCASIGISAAIKTLKRRGLIRNSAHGRGFYAITRKGYAALKRNSTPRDKER